MSENEFECDFCERKVAHLFPVNGGLWALCRECMEFEFGTIPAAYSSKKKLTLFPSKRYDIYGEEE